MLQGKKWASYSLIVAMALGTVFTGTTAQASETPKVLMVYDDGIRNDFIDYSLATHNLAQTSIVHSGKQAVEMQPDRDRGLYFYKDRVAYVSDYDTLQFWVNGGSTGGQGMKLVIQTGGVPVVVKPFSELLPNGVPANQWVKVELNLAELAIPNGIFDGILIQGTTDGTQPAIYFDDIALLNKASVTPIPQVDGLTVFDDYLSTQFVNYSWMEHNVNQVQYVHTGIHAVQMTPDRDKGLYFYKDRVGYTTDYENLQFWVNGGATGGQQLKLVIQAGGLPYYEQNLNDLLPGGIPANQWAKVELPMSALNLPNNIFDGIMLVGTTAGTQPALYLDDVVLTRKVNP